ncbi:hypothetical protein [Streptomyces olivaceoviridis]|uniref:hypothetical protein n=1 Tax=Streptomyces olivaceoviridis TaxID=1921 RepID=UPI0036A48AA8
MIRRGTGRRGGQADRHPAPRLTVSRAGERVHLVHTGGTPPRRLADIADWLGPARPEEAAVLVGASLGEDGVEGLCDLLVPVLQRFKDDGVRLLRLVMSAGADEAEGRPSTARLICERWELDVLATAGPAVVVPDGTLFSPDLPDAPGGWWHFSFREVPRPVGSRLPIPDWEAGLRRMDGSLVADHVVEPVPAGLLIRHAGVAPAAVHTLPYAVPPDPDRPHLLVDAVDVPAAGLATVIAALPGRVRKDIRLLSLDGRSLLETGQEVADLLGTDVHVANGIPVVVDGDDPETDEAGGASTELYMVDADGTPAWRPFTQTLTCAPAADGRGGRARVSSWHSPAPLLKGARPDALPFDPTWKVALTPAGLWAGPRSSEPPLTAVTRTADADTVAIELGAPRRALDDALWPSLDRLFGELDPEVRERAVVHVHGVLGSKGMEHLRRLTVRHNFSLMPLAREEAEAEGAAASVPSTAEPLPSAETGGTEETEETDEARGTSGIEETEEALEARGTEETQEFEETEEAGEVLRVDGSAFPERGNRTETPVAPRELPTQTGSTSAVRASGPSPARARVRPQEQTQPPATGRPPSGSSPAPAGASAASAGTTAAPAPSAPPASRTTTVVGEVPASATGTPGKLPNTPPAQTGAPSAPTLGTPSAPLLGIPSAPAVGTPPAPAVDTPSAPTVGTPPAPAVGTPPAPAVDTPSASAPGTPSAPAPGTPSAPPAVNAPPALGTSAPETAVPPQVRGNPAAPPAPQPPSAGVGSPSEPSRRATGRVGAPDTSPERGASDSDHKKLRAYLGPFWKQHRTAASQIVERLFPASSREQSDALIAELVAVHVYMTAVDDAQLRAALAHDDDQSRTLLRCLRSGMRRLPSYRGAAVSTAEEFVARLTPEAAGDEWEGNLPVRAVSVGRTYPGPSTDHLLIWSVTGRRSGTRAGDDGQDVLFARESRFRVLGVARRGPATVGLLQEVPRQAHASLPHLDAALLNRLRTVLDLPSAAPERYTGPPAPPPGTSPVADTGDQATGPADSSQSRTAPTSSVPPRGAS